MNSKIKKELFEFFEIDENHNFKLITNLSSTSSEEVKRVE